METIAYEKKRLMRQWQELLLGLQNRDEAFMSAEETNRKQNETYLTIISEVKGCKATILKEQNRNSQLTEKNDSIETENAHMQSLKQKYEDEVFIILYNSLKD